MNWSSFNNWWRDGAKKSKNYSPSDQSFAIFSFIYLEFLFFHKFCLSCGCTKFHLTVYSLIILPANTTYTLVFAIYAAFLILPPTIFCSKDCHLHQHFSDLVFCSIDTSLYSSPICLSVLRNLFLLYKGCWLIYCICLTTCSLCTDCSLF